MNAEIRRASAARLLAAIVIVSLLFAPFFLWGNPYPPPVLDYWRIGLWIAVGAAAIAVMPGVAKLESITAIAARWLTAPSASAFAIGVALLTAALVLVTNAVVFHGYASTSDEIAQLWHAKMLSQGWLALPADPNPEFFAIDNVIDRGKWYSHFPIGGPLSLVPGVIIGAPQVVNAVLTGASAAALYHACRAAFGEVFARVTALLFAFTPTVLFLSATYLNHAPTLFFATMAFAAAVSWDRATGRRQRHLLALGIGVGIGAIATIRPLDAVVVAIAIAIGQAGVLLKARGRIPELATQAAGGIAASSPLFLANWATNGSPLRFGYDVMWGEGHRVGFHADPQGEVHTLSRALEHAVTYMGELNYTLLSWPIPAMLLVVAGVLMLRRSSPWYAAFVTLFLAQLGAYAAYWGIGEFMGPRFLFTAVPALLVLVVAVPAGLRARFGIRPAVGAAVFFMACMVCAWIVPGIPASARGLARQARGQRTSMKVDVVAAARSSALQNAVVFIRESMSGRLLRRMWGIGVSRQDAAALLASRDGCALFERVAEMERSPAAREGDAGGTLARLVPALPSESSSSVSNDPQIRVATEGALPPACAAESDPPGFIPLSFGAALPYETIGADGRIGGDVVYAADLGAHNEVLRERFGNRKWYRLGRLRNNTGSTELLIRPY